MSEAPFVRDVVHLLVVDDDAGVRESVSEYLAVHGYSVSVASDGASMRESIALREPALVVLDIGLPGEGGLALAEWLRRRGPIGIIMLTGHSDPIDRVAGLELGADDYVAKPFVPRELLARIRAVMRRQNAASSTAAPADPLSEGPHVRIGTKRLNLSARVLQDDRGGVFPLTAAEYNLLKAFADHPRRVLTRDLLLDLAEARGDEVFDRSIDVRITRLRRKIEPDPEEPTLIRTVRGVGYVFSPDGRPI